MKKSRWRSLGSALLAVVLALQFSAPALAYTNQQENTASLFTPNANSVVTEQFAPEDEVRIIVELEDAPLLDEQVAMRAYSSAGDYLNSDEAQSHEAALASARKRVTRAMNTSDMDITVEREYSAVINGMSVLAQAGDLEAIQEMDGVKEAFIAEKYALIEPVAYDPQLTDSVPAVGGDIAQKTGYTGKRTVVAILDTGLDLSHEAFQGAVNSPKYMEEDIAQLISNNKLTIGKLAASVVYQSDKVPFAFDYADDDTNVSGGDSHGTHVAGIVGANSGDVVTGVAPDAQLMIMKVFGDNSDGAYDNDILAALDDAVKLGADVINMSLGSPAGFSEASSKTMREVYERVENAGVSLMVAAGNAYSSTYQGASGNDLPLTTNPDNSTVSSPSTYSAALSVASMNNTKSTAAYFVVGDRQIRYNDAAETASGQFTSLPAGVYEYVDCGVGASENFAGVSVSGKIALIQRGGLNADGSNLTFAQKEENARAAGAKAAIIYDNVEGELVSMATAHAIPCIFISKADGEWMVQQSEKKLTADPSYLGQFSDSYSGKMSDFSSWGVTPDLKLKPEITAPGGNIYSTLPNNLYGSMSGTSMASPHLAGAGAIMEQYINEEPDGLNLSQAERTALANALLMSTAAPVRDENGNTYSPRKQGAGLIQLNRATKSRAYLLAADGGRPVLNLGESTNGSFDVSFLAERLGTETIQYDVAVSVQTEGVVTENGVQYIAQQASPLTDDMVTVTVPVSLTLDSDEKTVSGKIALTEQGRSSLSSQFPNGIFIEGYVTLTPKSGDSIPLSIPFMGFYGDWSAAPLFDSTLYDDKPANVVEMWLGQFRNATGGGYILGTNQYGDGNVVDANKIAIQGGDKTRNVTAVCALLRNADSLTYSVTDSAGDTVYSETSQNESKSYYSTEAFHTPMASKGWITTNTWGDYLPDGQYTYTVTGMVSGKSQSVSFPITIDSEKPEIISSVVEGSQWKVTVKDNHYVQAVCATLGSTPLTGWVNPDENAPGKETTVIFDLSNSAFTGLTQAKIGLVDYADNQYVSDWYSLKEAVVVRPTSVKLDKTQQQLTVGDTASLSATVLPENASNRTVTWSSSAPAVVTVDGSGKLTAVAEGTATITAKTVNDLTASCRVTVQKATTESGTVLASVSAPASVAAGERIPFTMQLEQMERVATVSFTFKCDGALTGGAALGQNGFTVLDGIRWKDGVGTLMLSYLGNGAGGSLTAQALTDIARITFQTTAESGSLGLTLTGVTVSGYDAEGKSVYLSSGIKTAYAKVTVGNRNYDLNHDGVVDLLDITYCQMYYRATSESADWEQASACDLDGNGVVNIQDMVLIMRAYLL